MGFTFSTGGWIGATTGATGGGVGAVFIETVSLTELSRPSAPRLGMKTKLSTV
jgi:hypothetical protein